MSTQNRLRREPTTVLRDLEALQLRQQGMTLRQIADAMGDAPHAATAKRRIDRVIGEVRSDAVEEYRAANAVVLLNAQRRLVEILHARHVLVSEGRIVRDEDGEVILDDGPAVAAARALVGNVAELNKMFNVYPASKTEISGEIRAEVTVVDEFVRRLDALSARLAADADEAGRVARPREIEAGHTGR